MADGIEARYLLEVYELTSGGATPWDHGAGKRSKRLKGSILLPNVSKVEVIRVPATARTWTLGVLPVKEARGYRQNNIYVTGQSGQAQALYDQSRGDPAVMSGKAAYEELRTFLELYEANVASHRSAVNRDAKALWLVFRMLWEGEAYIVDNVRLRESRDTSRSRHSYAYDLQMLSELSVADAMLGGDGEYSRYSTRGLGRVATLQTAESLKTSARGVSTLTSRAEKYGSSSGLVSRDVAAQAKKDHDALEHQLQRNGGSLKSLSVTDGPLKEFLGGTGAYQGVSKAVGGFLGSLHDANTAIDRGAIDRIERAGVSASVSAAKFEAPILTMLGQAGRAKDAIRRAFDGLDINSRRRASSAVRSALATINAIISPFDIAFGASGDHDYSGSPFSDSSIRGSGADFSSDPFSSSSRVLGRRGGSDTDFSSGDSFVEVEAVRGDSLHLIAQRELGDGGRAEELRLINGMLSEWEMADGTPFGPGVVILVPDPEGIAGIDTGDPLGGDWMWDQEKQDFVVLGDGGDFAIVQGPDNLIQSVTRRASVLQGSVGVYPYFGLPRVNGLVMTLGEVGYLASHAAESFREDPRVASVKNMVVSSRGDTIVLSADLVIANKKGSTLPLSAPVGGDS